jgi:YVTN family beta-propeller protein
MKFYFAIFVLLFFNACVKDKPQEPIKTAVSIDSENRGLVVNEGPFRTGNGSISLYDSKKNEVVEDIYFQQNNFYLGNIVQSISLINGDYYIVSNNSNKINVASSVDFKNKTTITGFNSPRYILPVSYSKAYVSDLYANSVQIVNLNSNSITGSIPCMAGTEKMAVVYNHVFITNSNSNYCYVVNATTNSMTDSIAIGKGCSSIVTDKNDKVWLLATGSSTSNQTGKLVRVNPLTLQIEQSLSFNSNDSPSNLCCNKTRDTLYFLNKGVSQFLISATTLPLNPVINQGSKTYYGLGINPKDYTIYVSDAIDYTQKSKIEIYNTSGQLITSFNAGLISNGFLFE